MIRAQLGRPRLSRLVVACAFIAAGMVFVQRAFAKVTCEVTVEATPVEVSPGDDVTIHVVITCTNSKGKTATLPGQKTEVKITFPSGTVRTFKVKSCKPKTIQVSNSEPPGLAQVDAKVTHGAVKGHSASTTFEVKPI